MSRLLTVTITDPATGREARATLDPGEAARLIRIITDDTTAPAGERRAYLPGREALMLRYLADALREVIGTA